MMNFFIMMTTTIPSNDLVSQLTCIGLKTVAQNLDDFIARATKGRWSPRTILEEVSRTEARERARLSLERRLRMSGIKSFKAMADFDWNWPKKIAHSRIMAGYSVLFRGAADIIEDLQCDSPELRRRKIKAYARPHLLCIDELAYLSYDDNAADLLYQVINRRYERRSVVITTNRAFKEWNQVFPNATCIATLLDRLTHHADVTVIDGESYRVHESEQEAAARRKKR